jgi:hypothetical protein
MMYTPLFNTVLIELEEDAAAKYTSHDDSMLGKSYRKGTVTEVGGIMATKDYPVPDKDLGDTRQWFVDMIGKRILFNEGTESGTVFDHDGKRYAFIYWWDIRGTTTNE